ncbi:MAG: DUF2752 domain-containing protein [Phycisphaerales bacterium]
MHDPEQMDPKLPRPTIPRLSSQGRLVCAAVAAALLAPLVTAAFLRPAAGGVGTHTQLGLSPCPWLVMWGKPCPSCGMTTAFAAAAHGDPWGSFLAQPMGALLALLAATGFWIALYGAVSGSRAVLLTERLLRARILWGFAAFWGLSWAYKVVTHQP